MRVMIVVTHLLGVGHLARASALADAFAQEGHRTLLVSGGDDAPLQRPGGAVIFRQLPPVHAVGADFRNLRDGKSEPAGPELLARRGTMLVELVRRFRPQVLLTETFPFGRRALRDEFEALLEAAERLRPRPVVFASVRDILNPPSNEPKAQRAEEFAREHFDAVLVHGDEASAPLRLSWPVSPTLETRLRYTGYVAPERESGPRGEGGGILVSGGGGMAGLRLLSAAAEAAPLVPERRWHLLVGAAVREADFAALAALAARSGGNLQVERARADFRALLARADLSVSLAGYNTAVDLAVTGARAVLVPYAEGGEREQTLRAEGLARAGRARMLRETDLTAQSLAETVEAALADPRPDPQPTGEGARRTVAFAQEFRASRSKDEEAFRALERRLDRIGKRGATLDVWWRDDDAASDGAALRRLLALREEIGVPLAVVANPSLTGPDLADALQGERDVAVLMHGPAGRNDAPEDGRLEEVEVREAADLLAELWSGLRRHREHFGALALPVLVAPGTRIDSSVRGGLAAAGFGGLSLVGAREAAMIDGLLIRNTHLDPVRRDGARGLVDVPPALKRFAAAFDLGEPLGILTHHLVHDGPTWRFAQRLLELLARHPAVRFPSVAELWGGP